MTVWTLYILAVLPLVWVDSHALLSLWSYLHRQCRSWSGTQYKAYIKDDMYIHIYTQLRPDRLPDRAVRGASTQARREDLFFILTRRLMLFA